MDIKAIVDSINSAAAALGSPEGRSQIEERLRETGHLHAAAMMQDLEHILEAAVAIGKDM